MPAKERYKRELLKLEVLKKHTQETEKKLLSFSQELRYGRTLYLTDSAGRNALLIDPVELGREDRALLEGILARRYDATLQSLVAIDEQIANASERVD